MWGGFSLIELMIALGLVAIGSAMAAPAFKTMMAENRLTGKTNEFVSALSLARSEAIRQQRTVELMPVKDNDWGLGWELHLKDTPDVPIAVFEALPENMRMISEPEVNSIGYKGNGVPVSVSAVDFWICDNRNQGRLIKLNPGGGFRVPDRDSELQNDSGCQ